MIKTGSAVVACALALALALAGCGKGEKTKGGSAPLPKSDLPDSYLLAAKPSGAKGAAEVRKTAKTGDQVVVTGVVGGRKTPFVSGVAAFTIVDESAKKCTADECDTPWDFCCETPENLAAGSVTIEFRDKSGAPLKTPAQGFHGLDHMKTVVVTGEAKRDEANNVVVVAHGVFIQP
jgi:hypothetical protein